MKDFYLFGNLLKPIVKILAKTFIKILAETLWTKIDIEVYFS
jgi:hypothetical protein